MLPTQARTKPYRLVLFVASIETGKDYDVFDILGPAETSIDTHYY